MAARSGLFNQVADGRQIELSLLSMALEHVRAQEYLRPDADADDERLINSLCQFDALASLAAIADANSLDSSVFYTSFARFYTFRTEPAIRRLIQNSAMRDLLFPLGDDTLAQALREIDRRARQESFRYAGWDGYVDDAITRFLDAHPAPEP